MTEKIRTLVIERNGPGWQTTLFDTVWDGFFRLPRSIKLPPILGQTHLGSLFQKAITGAYEYLSYVRDWRDALLREPRLDVTLCSMSNLVDFYSKRKLFKEADLIIILHSAMGDDLDGLLKNSGLFEQRRGKLVTCVGNEYDQMGEKVRFIKESGTDYIVSQLTKETAEWLYADCDGSEVLCLPHALNPTLYKPVPLLERKYDIGFIGSLYPNFIGDTERNDFILKMEKESAHYNLKSYFRYATVEKGMWATRLQGFAAIVGGEAGSYYLDRSGALLASAKKWEEQHRNCSFDDLWQTFFKSPREDVKTGKAISSRHFEPIGTKTCQILIEGDYNGILKADEHYISIKKDYSNLDEAIEQFKDEHYRQRIVEQAYEYVISNHTYAYRINSLIDSVFGSL